MVCTILYLSIYLLRNIIVVVVGLSRFSRVQLFVTLWTVACQTPLSMGFSRQGYWSKLKVIIKKLYALSTCHLLCISYTLKLFIKTHGKDGEQAFTPSPLYWSAGWIPWEGKSTEEFPVGDLT